VVGYHAFTINGVAIMHQIERNHFVMLTRTSGVVWMWDTLDLEPTTATRRQVSELVGPEAQVIKAKCQKQTDPVGCGVMAIAFLVSVHQHTKSTPTKVRP
jgi:hypothetical protein